MPDGAQLIVSLLVSTVGFALLVYGKKQQRLPQLLVGLVLLIYPYFVPSALLSMGIGVCLVALMAVGIRAGL